MAQARNPLPRGIAPDLLVSQVRNTMPYLFEGETRFDGFPPAQILRDYAAAPPEQLSHFEYFRLCVSSHYSSCGTPVPTDVDNQIRHKLWPAALPVETALQMAELVLESRRWNFSQVTRRETHGLSGHLGEWFTLSSGAYCALGQYREPEAKAVRDRLFAEIRDEVDHHSEVFGALWRAGDGLSCLKASAAIAHNFGDLDRVMDMWSLGVGDPLRLQFYKLGAQPFDQERKLRYLGRLWVAGELYKSRIENGSMAAENHRHFPLRKPRCLRSNRELLITTGPFHDDWGRLVARTLSEDDLVEAAAALKEGWVRLVGTFGYGRALHGLLEVKPGVIDVSDLDKTHQAVLKMTQETFEKKWAAEAVRLMDEIPSRAT